MNFFLDTNILLAYLRQHALVRTLQDYFELETAPHRIFTSAICIGELKSIGIQNSWGIKRLDAIDELEEFILITSTLENIVIDRYAEIDAFSQGRLEGKKLDCSARNMGKNDLWIAAAASVLNATLITTDRDFDHLHSHYLNVARFDLKKFTP
ncbi:type II toxin-antitoxin system VapC family toxin [Dyadobacter sp. MSC1_007]|jgi:tRNA(fMet)-specific endonuclease VapC|uniref:type II toxin-antitoxin system VapC family toxin n=1 Tax=Dyadobacter sp. MSC1_007 TaxID=2909264 RepID=UPI00202FDEC5|nr:type II toxin-antitoxin system VapC family toxin [Dyadobacter sp. MSC1_007]